MEYQYTESFDPVMRTYRRIYNLDAINLFFLSEFSNKKRKIVKYSVDVEKANDSHYIIDTVNIAKLADALHCDNSTNALVPKIARLLLDQGENGLVKFLEDNEIKFEQFHFDDYPYD